MNEQKPDKNPDDNSPDSLTPLHGAAQHRDRVGEAIPQTGYYGHWVGLYPDSGPCLTKIIQARQWLICVKLGGNEYVKSGETTWVVNLRTKEAKGCLGEKGTIDRHMVPGRIQVLSHDQIRFEWLVNGKRETVDFMRM